MAFQFGLYDEKYKSFPGKNIEQMPKLISEGRVPINVSQVMQERMIFRENQEFLERAWRREEFTTGDAVIYHPDGRIKVVLDSPLVRQMNPSSSEIGGGLRISEEDFRKSDGGEFKANEFQKVNYFTKKEAKENPIWQLLARDKSLLNGYVDFLSAGYAAEDRMSIYLHYLPRLSCEMHLIRITEFEFETRRGGSGVSGYSAIGCERCSLVGFK